MKDLPAQSVSSGMRARGSYAKFTPKQKATVDNYAVLHGTSAALRHFKTELRWLTINDWKDAIVKQKDLR